MAQNGEIAERRGMDGLCHLQVLHLGIGKRLVDLINRPAGYPSLVEEFDPLGAGFLPGHRHEHLHDFVPIVGTRSGGGETRISNQVWMLDRAAEELVDLIPWGRDGAMPVLCFFYA